MMPPDPSKHSAGFFEGIRRSFPKEWFDSLTDDQLASFNLVNFRFQPAASLRIYLFSSDKSVQSAVTDVFDDISNSPPCRNRNKHMLKVALNMVLTNLLIQHFSSPNYYSRVSFNKNNYNLIKRYNPYEIGYVSVKGAILGLLDQGYIQFLIGYQDPNSGEKRQTRIRPTAKLTELLITNHSISIANFRDIEQGQEIVLKNDEKKLINYKDTDKTNSMRKVIKAYNKLLLKSEIKLSSTDAEIDGSIKKQNLNLSAVRYHRSFNNGSFELGGRFYGPWWQSVSSELRKHILINGNPTVELDYSAMHIHLLYSREGKKYYRLFPEGDDPYLLDGYGDYERKVLKYGILIALNAANKSQGLHAIREKLNEEGLFKKGLDLHGILNQFCAKHPLISHYLYSQIGLETQYTDSCVAEYVIKKLTRKGIISLCIHDSFIVEEKHKGLLRDLMTNGFKANGLKSMPLIKEG